MSVDQNIEVMLPSGEWDCEKSDYDAEGWVDLWKNQVGQGLAPLPTNGSINLGAFAGLRVAQGGFE